MRILVVDDEPQIIRVLRTSLQSCGYEVEAAASGEEGLTKFRASTPDLVITDLSMSQMSGLELTRAIRKMANTPIIVLSVRESDSMKVSALDAGADDYVTKPFSMQELLARVRAQLRRTGRDESATKFTAGDFTLDTESRLVTARGEPVHLSPKEFDLLLLFMRNPGRVLTHRVLLQSIWGPLAQEQPEYLRVLVAQLRRKIESGNERYIQSEPWIGYRFEPEI